MGRRLTAYRSGRNGLRTYASICADGTRLSVGYDVVYADRSGCSLAAAEDSVPVGGTLAFRVVNESGEKRTVAPNGVFDVQKRTGGDWQSVYRYDPPLLIEKIGRVVEAGGSITWNLRMTKAGLTHYLNMEDELLTCCSSLTPGRYRFVYWGLGSESNNGSDAESGIAVRFELTEES